MEYKIFFTIAFAIVTACATQKSSTTTAAGRGDARASQIQIIDDNTYLLTEMSSEKDYGFKKSNPVKVGGISERSGPLNERRFLNALLGPNGEEIRYLRAGSCCPFKTPNGMLNNTGMLDIYRIFWSGGQDTLDIYINMYDKGDLKIPIGLTAKKKM